MFPWGEGSPQEVLQSCSWPNVVLPQTGCICRPQGCPVPFPRAEPHTQTTRPAERFSGAGGDCLVQPVSYPPLHLGPGQGVARPEALLWFIAMHA